MKQIVVQDGGVHEFFVAAQEAVQIIDAASTDRSIVVALTGEGAKVELLAQIYATDDETKHVQHTVIHQAANTQSVILVKSVLDDRAVLDYDATITIDQPDCSGEQRADVLLLSEHARAKAVPHLHISSMHSVCSHGVTISKIDERIMYFMQSRGITREEAKSAAIEAHVSPVKERIAYV